MPQSTNNNNNREHVNLLEPSPPTYEAAVSDDILPTDSFNFCKITLFFLGLVYLLPWNVYLTSIPYLIQYKFNVSSTATNLFNIMTTSGQFTNLFVNFICMLFSHGRYNDFTKRILLSLIVITAHFIQMMCFTFATIETETLFIFYVVIITSLLICCAMTGVLNAAIFQLASIFPPDYINYIIIGNNVAGALVSITSLFSKFIFNSIDVSSFFYYMIAYMLTTLCIVFYVWMVKTKFFRHRLNFIFLNLPANSIESDNLLDLITNIIILHWECASLVKYQLFALFINFVSTLMIFPLFLLNVHSSGYVPLFVQKYWVDITVFITFNFSVLLGNVATRYINIQNKYILLVLVYVRVLLGCSLFLLCNYHPVKDKAAFRLLPVIIENDYVYWLINIIYSFMFGILTSLLAINIIASVPLEYKKTAAVLISFTINFGVVCGLQFYSFFEYFY